jgi:hypothetical protein
MEKMNPAEAQDRFLTEAVIGVSTIEMVGEMAVPGIVALDIGIQEEDWDDMAGVADNVKAPGLQGDLAALHGEGDLLVGRRKRGFGGPDDVGFGLLAERVKVLLEVAAAVDERDGDQ